MPPARILATLLLAILALLTSLDPASSTTKEDEFWAWFQNNEDRLYQGQRSALLDELHKVDRALAYEIWPTNEDGLRTLVLSVNGYVDAFPVVETLHAAAPRLPRWNIIRFRPRVPFLEEGKVVVSNDGVRQPGEMRYLMTVEQGMATISVYLPGAERPPSRANNYIARLHLLDFLGEEDFGRFVRQVSVLDVTAESYNLSKPVFQLPPEFDAAFKN